MDRDWYINECLRQLNDLTFYRPLDNDITDDIQKRSMYSQIWKMFGQRPILQLLQKERSLHSRVLEKGEITPKNPFRTLPHHWNSEFETLVKLLRPSTSTEPEEGMKGTTLKTKLDTRARGNTLLLWIYRYMYRQNMDANGKQKHWTNQRSSF